MKIDSNLLTAKDCAKYLGISISYFYKLRKQYPNLPYYTLGTNARRYYDGAEVRDYLRSQVSKVSRVNWVKH